jgi:hypothetical protein
LEAWNNRQPEAFDDLIAHDVVRHCQATPNVEIRSLNQLKDFYGRIRRSFLTRGRRSWR